ncbi:MULTISPECIES: acyltransferase family protein [unclassified Beijerinckia]|uniref:acyltransferase family protein n=1 Tax=unclassified Beijerinckia TaxID=2638183 RepID=UPI00089B4D68|nr:MULTISPECIES: acyltransferase family protein [unclassified Beijerinckia]MDH7798736.1 putative membrane protein YcfT [Beijerinckia sp. GAS462]SED31330.1 Uncharacterized membrane protein YcfT [Beijerinckia sp. 28-YEA-48]
MTAQTVSDVSSPLARPATKRLAWVDTAKGICILMVVMLHTVTGVDEAFPGTSGWMHHLISFAKPFRMPDFFLVSGLFATAAMARPWRDFLDRKLIYFGYFLALWMAIILLVKARGMGLTDPQSFLSEYLWGFVEPFSTLWFIHLLPLLFIALRLVWTRPLWLVLIGGFGLHLLAAFHLDPNDYGLSSTLTRWTAINAFCLFFIYFYIGAKAGPRILQWASRIAAQPLPALGALLVWALIHGLIWKAGYSSLPGLGFILGLAGALAVVTASVLLAKYEPFGFFRHIGSHSLAIYLTFVLPMAAMRIALLKSGFVTNVDVASLLVLAVAVTVPIVLDIVVKNTPFSFLYTRPRWARLT